MLFSSMWFFFGLVSLLRGWGELAREIITLRFPPVPCFALLRNDCAFSQIAKGFHLLSSFRGCVVSELKKSNAR